MRQITYTDGQVVKQGDYVQVSLALFRKRHGKVVYVYDPSRPSGPNGDNDYGVSIRLDDGQELWGVPEKNIKLVSRMY